jgi:hypothetical protein
MATVPSSERAAVRRRRLVAGGAIALVLIAVAVVVVRAVAPGGSSQPVLVPRADAPTGDVLAYEPGQDDALARAAAFGLSHPLYAKSPGGVLATAERTAAFRPLVEEAVSGSGVDPDLLEAIVFLESAGRPDVIAGDDPARASGLTQILAETGRNFLGMRVDLAQSRSLTTRIRAAVARGDGRSTSGSTPSGPSPAPSVTWSRREAASARTTSRSSRTTWGSGT